MTYGNAGQYGPEALLLDLSSGALAPLRSTAITVKTTAGATATLYMDRTATTTAANPVSTDASGNLTFFAMPGQYTLNYTSPLGVAVSLAVSVGVDPADKTPDVFGDGTYLDRAGASATYAKVVPLVTPTSAGLASAAALAGAGGCVVIPANTTLVLSTAVTLDDVALIGVSATSLVSVPSSLGTGVAALTFAKSAGGASYPVVGGFKMTGPGVRTLGTKTALCNGIAITGQCQPTLRDLLVQNFDSGIVWNNDVGHIYHRGVISTNNYYGIYCQKNTFDYFVSDSQINGNTFANFATPADQGFAGMVVTNTHCGFAPYGIYQEGTPAAQGSPKVFMQEVMLRHCRFEAMGNGAIFTNATQDANNKSIASNLLIEHPGFSWSTSYRISGLAQDYAVVLNQTDRMVEIVVGAEPFLAGAVGNILVKVGGADAFILRGASTVAATADVTTSSGSSNVFVYAAPLANGASASFASVATTGNMTVPTTGYLQLNGNNVRIGGGNFVDHNVPLQGRDSGNGYASTWSIGNTGAATFPVGISGGTFTTATRPSATSVAGRQIYDTTISKPIWSDGTAWRDATGTAV